MYCRSGYEADLLAEIDDKLAKHNAFGYARFVKDSAFLRYTLSVPKTHKMFSAERTEQDTKSLEAVSKHLKDMLLTYNSMPALNTLIFARQKTLIINEVYFDDLQDRVNPVLVALGALHDEAALTKPLFGDVRVEYPDTEEGKQIAKFCKKYTVPLRNTLRKYGFLSQKAQSHLPYLHVFFERGEACILSVSFAHDRSEDSLGVRRLKFPSDAPSRSTLKLEEAIHLFCNKAQQAQLFQAGMSAVDLGACPGGWTYQLVSRGIHVEAVDNGAMDDKLMQTGLVTYMPADGFTYVPKDKHVDWLVCDMIEQPDRVAKLMVHWLKTRMASAAIFNLKLPMKKRYLTLAPIIESFFDALNDEEEDVYLQAKHLYHNRDEVTFIMIKNSQMRAVF
jgi:23S rRNA (cytidine2498-2'-O)-methyltransferase